MLNQVYNRQKDLLLREFKQCLATNPKDTSSLYADGLALARSEQDDAARVNFTQWPSYRDLVAYLA